MRNTTYPLCSTHPSPALVSNNTLWLHLCATRRALMAASSSCVSCVTSQPGRRSVASTSKQYCNTGTEHEQRPAGRTTCASQLRRRRTCRVSTVVAISVSSQSKTITVSPSTARPSVSALFAGSAFTGEAGGELGGVSGARVCLHDGGLLDGAKPAAGSSASSGAIPLNSASRLTAELAGGVHGASAPVLPPHRSRAGRGIGTAIVSLCFCVGIGLDWVRRGWCERAGGSVLLLATVALSCCYRYYAHCTIPCHSVGPDGSRSAAIVRRSHVLRNSNFEFAIQGFKTIRYQIVRLSFLHSSELSGETLGRERENRLHVLASTLQYDAEIRY